MSSIQPSAPGGVSVLRRLAAAVGRAWASGASRFAREIEPTTFNGYVLGVDVRDDRLVVTRQRVTITDHGSGVGAELLSAVLRPDEIGLVERGLADASNRPEPAIDTAPVTGADPVFLEVDPVLVEARPDAVAPLVAVSLDGASGGAWDRAGAADELLGILTRKRLDGDSVWPRLHGGAVADGDGRAVVVLGRSGAGKSTLIAHLAHGGLTLVNDEQVTLYRPWGMIAGFTRPVAIKPGGAKFLPPGLSPRPVTVDVAHTELFSAGELGTAHRLTAEPVLVVLPDRASHGRPADDATDDSHSSGVQSEVLGRAGAIEAMAANNLDMVNRPVAALEAFSWLAANVPVVRLTYAETADGAAAVRELLANPPKVDVVNWIVHDASKDSDAELGEAGATIAASPEVVWVEIADDVVLYNRESRQLAVLNGSGSALWKTLPVPAEWLVVPEPPGGDCGPDSDYPEQLTPEAAAAFLSELIEHGFLSQPQPAT